MQLFIVYKLVRVEMLETGMFSYKFSAKMEDFENIKLVFFNN